MGETSGRSGSSGFFRRLRSHTTCTARRRRNGTLLEYNNGVGGMHATEARSCTYTRSFIDTRS